LQAQGGSAGAEGQPGGGVQQPVAQRLGFADREVVVEGEQLGPGDDVLGDQRELQPDGVVIEVAERQVVQAGLLAVADAVFGVGAGAVQSLELDRFAVEVGEGGQECCTASSASSAVSSSRATASPRPRRSRASTSERMPGSIGTPVKGVEMRLVDEDRDPVLPGEVGEIAIRGHNVMKGYLNRPEATAEAIDADGWFYTGDIARVDAQGRFYIVDRKKDLIIRGGYNVYPREVEEVLYAHPAVAEVVVIGVPHPELGEEVAAAVRQKPGAEVSADELREYAKAHVAAYKYPR
jgi:hypothetical protein